MSIPRMLCQNLRNCQLLIVMELDSEYFVQKYRLKTSDGDYHLVSNYSTLDSKKAWAFYRKQLGGMRA